MRSFTHELVTGRVVFGSGALSQVADEVRRLGVRRVLLVAGRHARRYADRIGDEIGGLLAGRIEEAAQHVPAEVADDATRRAEEAAADLLLCVGGGSATGLAKAVAHTRGTPILAVPTTYAGSEMSDIWGITEGHRKTTGRDPGVRPVVVVYDPELTLSMSPELTATSGMNALAHDVEALYAPNPSPVVTLIAEESIRVLARALPVCVDRPDDLAGRSDALYGAFLSGVAMGNTVMGVHHKICHVLGGAYRLPHSGVHSAVLPYATAYNREAAPEAMCRIAAALAATDAAVGLWGLARRIGAPTDLVSLGFDPALIPEVAAEVSGARTTNPRPVTDDSIRELLRAACAGASPVPTT